MTRTYQKTEDSTSDFYLECSDCSKIFKTKSDCDKHKLSNNCSNNDISLVSYFTCSKCNQIFHKDDDCFSHIQICSKNNSITTNECYKCKKKFSSKYSCERHINGNKCRSLRKTKLDFFQCYNCLLKFKNKYAIIKHFKRKVCINSKHSKCFVHNCNVYFRKREQLIDHLIIAHKNDNTFEGSNLNWNNIQVENLTFTNENEFQYWLETISKDYNCNYFCSTNKLVKNSIIYKIFRCQYDKRLYPNKLNLSQHKRISNPNLFCPSRVCTKIIEGKILVTYYKTHNHQPLPNKRKYLNYSRNSTSQNVDDIIEENMNFNNDDEDGGVFIENDYFNMEYKHEENVEKNMLVQSEIEVDSSVHDSNKKLDLNIINNMDANETEIEQNESEPKEVTLYFETNNETSLEMMDYKNNSMRNYDNNCVVDSIKRENVVKHDSEQTEPEISFDISPVEDNNTNVEVIKSNSSLYAMKSNIGQLFSHILEYVESSESVEFLNKMKQNLEDILEACDPNLSQSGDGERNCLDESDGVKNESVDEGGYSNSNVKGNDKPKYFDFANFHVLINTVNNINQPQ